MFICRQPAVRRDSTNYTESKYFVSIICQEEEERWFGVFFESVRGYLTICLCHSLSTMAGKCNILKQSIFTLFPTSTAYPHQFNIIEVNSKCSEHMKISEQSFKLEP